MTHFDVFNGDADGLCALHQLRLTSPRDAVLVTGVKRDIALLQRVAAEAGDSVTALDISFAANRDALSALLERGVSVQYFDHHYAGEMITHPALDAVIDTSPNNCTAMLVDRYLGGRQRIWAIVAAFGDNMDEAACELAEPLSLDPAAVAKLLDLGESLAYNAYGDSEADLIIHPADLYRILRAYADPFRFMVEEPIFRRITEARHADLELAREIQPERSLSRATMYVLPDVSWSRRIRGIFSNYLAHEYPDLAHAVLTPNAQGGYTVSVRAPLTARTGADALCRQFSSGGGRAEAAGINHLPRQQLPEFARQLDQAFS